MISGTEEEGSIRLLLVEDDVDSGPVVEDMLARKGVDVALVSSGEQAVEQLEQAKFDIVVTDVRLGQGMTGVELLEKIRDQYDDLPVILITGFDSLNSAIQAVRLGAQDYILKPFDDIESLLMPIRKAVHTHRLVAQNRRLRKELEESEARFRSVLDNAKDLIFRVDLGTGQFVYISPSCQDVLGVPQKEIESGGIAKLIEMMPGEDFEVLAKMDEQVLRSVEVRFRSPRHGLRWLSISASFVRDEETDQPVAVVGTARDVTDVRRMKEKEREYRLALARAERMKSLAILAGGVAHDLNNILMPIMTLPEAILDDILNANVPVPETLREDLAVIARSGERAAAVARDLLSLSRCQFLERSPLPINQVVDSVLLSGTILEAGRGNPKVNIQRQLSDDQLLVNGSENHLYQAVLNLLINAFEAMPEGGDLVVSTGVQTIEEPVSGYERIDPGEYVYLSVADTGHGISPEIIDRVFEPFHSHKKRTSHSGSGLGLAVVYGVVKGHEGYIDVTSVVDEGTEFRLYLPVCLQPKPEPEEEVQAVGGDETVLLVDDEDIPREMTARMLRQLGYTVLIARHGQEAVGMLRMSSTGSKPPFDLVLLDMVMEEGFDGLDTYREMSGICPAQKCLLISGFSDGDRVREAQRLGAGGFLQKPFSVNQLARKVRVELDTVR
jgi:PAS domain S-box-containing protein